jgi:UDP-N-acetylglucosamine--N-acetylmuramyl-(pentapeptide) pyrophosphoryl-undecaprenol N-acetylglucosamine transferase
MPHVIAAAELIICRGGAGTLWENLALGKPMIIIPLRGSGTRGDQVENARIFQEAGAAISLSEDPSPEKIAKLANSLAEDGERLRAMGKGGSLDAANRIAEAIARKVNNKDSGKI